MKYKQTLIPETTSIWQNLKSSDLRKAMFEFYRMIAKEKQFVVNKQFGQIIYSG